MFRTPMITALALGFVAFAATRAGAVVPPHVGTSCHVVSVAHKYSPADYCDSMHEEMENECSQNYGSDPVNYSRCIQRANKWFADCVARKCHPEAMGSMLGC